MTALAQYQRLETTGLWRDAPGAQRREAHISLGNATLVIAALSGQPLAHWSLPAIERLNPGDTPALYAPGADATETLEIAEPEMISAIETLRGAIEGARPHPGRLRAGIVALVMVCLAAIGALWLPGALMRQTAFVLPDAKRADLGDDLVAQLVSLSGQPCGDALGDQALGQLSARVFGEGAPKIVVLPEAVAGTLHVPGNILVIDRGLVEDHDTPDVLAGHLLAEDLRRRGNDPILRLLADAGLPATLRLLTTGQIAPGALRAHATRLVAERPASVSDAALLAAFEAAGVSSQPFAYALDISGESTLALIEADPMRGQQPAPILSDQNWIALQEICSG
ncbi:MAG: hypothetical protein AAGA70_14495 [Pseudomonadota bacterium]